MPNASEWLLEVGTHDGVSAKTLRFSCKGYVTGPSDTPANTVYDARIVSLGAYTRHLFGEGRTIGDVEVELSDTVLANADGELDGLLNNGFSGQPFVLKRLLSSQSAFSTAATVLTGTLEGGDASGGMTTFTLRGYDRRRDADVSIQKNTYGGTVLGGGASADGSPDMKGQLKPLLFGRCFSVPAVIVNPYNLILQFNDGPVSSIALMDGGIPLINDGDVSTLSALASSSGNGGHYKTCLALGLAKPFGAFNGNPGFIWTADVVEGSTSALRCAGAVVQRMLAKIGLTNINTASFTALNTLQPAEVGIYLDSDTSCLAAIRRVLDSIGGWIVPDSLGQFVVGRLDLPGAPVATVVEPQILTSSSDETLQFTNNPDTDGHIPARRVTLNWRKNWHVHTTSDLGPCVNATSATRASILQQEVQTVVADSTAVATKYGAGAPELVIDTLLTDATAVQTELTRRAAMYSASRVSTQIAVDIDDAALMIPGATIALQFSRYGFDSGKAMRIIGRSDDNQNEKAVLTVWG